MSDLELQHFMDRIERGEKIESTDWMPDDYRKLVIKQIHMHGISEVMGAYPEKEWVPKAPNLRRKLALIAKVQDEIGHGQLLLRVAEDAAKPLGKVRDDMITDLFVNKVKFHNVFHMEAPTWADAGIIGFLVDGGAIITQASLLESSYGPYARVLQRICAEESFHMQHGESVVLALAEGTAEQREMLQAAVNRWWPSMMFFFGPTQMSSGAQRMMDYKIRTRTNEELRQKFINRYVPRILALGLTVPDDKLAYNAETKLWTYTEPDWEWFSYMVQHNAGPKSQARIELRRTAHEGQQWVRDAMLRARQTVEASA
ncbi:1,2-phenylacetyl-CoA epoxidase subunit PaaA [Sulfoacidibacillus thermotolerans]|uniref:1,2-phenylacetyl-CoA epoxidase subunit A n=1 Tax=Sulfoacidibacillus thermotolerans TaxID=1765684 RepID=A0A2U3D772_SULT2|nr:1,2-phenylacetyl-CoA epoxidase subunit PaaA [Sulfoacidibacillus thermotolerans]PWI57121.1 1,2-phenylacetyl-CoA epoxidase subunit A [Sulfoacidibacillus thermotolerans]